jgi:hypothetical protein
MMKRTSVRFTACEVSHILMLIVRNEDHGEYTAPRAQYWKRSERIKSKLLKRLKHEAES